MKLLLDENMPHKLRQFLPGHVVVTAAFMQWGGIRNGKLLDNAASKGFDALLTVDAGIEFEQNLSALPCSVIIIRSASNAFEHIEPHLPAVLEVLKTLKPRTLVRIP
jgi:predicted nuclease of predicted toxin-antitoxin system